MRCRSRRSAIPDSDRSVLKQLVQYMNNGAMEVVEVPVPQLLPGYVLVRNAASLVSAGTEKMSADFARMNFVQKARSRPDLVRQVIEKARKDGILTAWESAQSRLEQPAPIGYSCSGTVLEAGDGVSDVHPGDRVACAGAGYALHAEAVCVPRNLIVKIPQSDAQGDTEVTFEEAAFVTLGAIAMHGLRLAKPQLGESVGVIGLGLIGLLTVQLAKLSGCRAFGMDPDTSRCLLAERFGCDATASDPEAFKALVADATNSTGVDNVIIAAATSSNSPVEVAGEIARSRGRVVAVGAVGTSIPRKIYYEKELEFHISRSYGPGRYDPSYEEKGVDYPAQYVRWTENRNMESFLQLVAQRKLQLHEIITHRVPINNAAHAYELITGKSRGPFLGVVIIYPDAVNLSHRVDHVPSRLSAPGLLPAAAIKIGLLGAGNFGLRVLVPAIIKGARPELIGVCSGKGVSANHASNKFGFRFCATDSNEILKDPDINVVAIATRHHLHAAQVLAALSAGKHVFCEKPLCINEQELIEIVRLYQYSGPKLHLMVGFNRRFAPMAKRLKSFVAEIREPLMVHYRVNAGYIARESWIQQPEQGGGRIIGEVCHFIDFLIYLIGESPTRVSAKALPNGGAYNGDNVLLTLDFPNGSIATISYVANGDKSLSKERLEIFGGGSTGVLEDFRRLELARNGRKQVVTSFLKQDKGHVAQWEAFAKSLATGNTLIPFNELVSSALITFRSVASLRDGAPIKIDVREFMNVTLDRDKVARSPQLIDAPI